MNTVQPVAIARCSQRIDRSRAAIFRALTDPDDLKHFWPRCAGTTPLTPGATARWIFDTAPVDVTCVEAEPDRMIRLVLSTGARVMLTLDDSDGGAGRGTVVHYCECGFGVDAETSAAVTARVTGAASVMLSDLKAFLESGARPVHPNGGAGYSDAA